MPKQMIEVEVPEGWEAVGYRCPREGEYYLDGVGSPDKATSDWRTYKRIIVRKAWEWPKWLLAPWIAMDKNGEWYAYKEQPDLMDCFVTWQSSGPSSLVPIDSLLFDFTPPPCTDWKQSLRKNPNYKELVEKII